MARIFDPNLERQIFGTEGPERLRDAIKKRTSVREFINETQGRLHSGKLLQNLAHIAGFVEPQYRTVDIEDAEATMANIYFNGVTVALGGLLLFTDARQREALARAKFDLPDAEHIDDVLEFNHQVAAQLMTVGHEGFDKAVAYHDLFEEIEDEVSPDARFISASKAGFGLPFYLLAKAIAEENEKETDKENNEELLRQIALTDTDDGIDWDAGLANLLAE